MDTFATRLNNLVNEALSSIYNYKGPLIEVLSDGSMGIDFDDSWIIVGYEDGNNIPYIRDKRNQGHFNRGNYSANELHFEDVYLEDTMNEVDICILADRLNK